MILVFFGSQKITIVFVRRSIEKWRTLTICKHPKDKSMTQIRVEATAHTKRLQRQNPTDPNPKSNLAIPPHSAHCLPHN